MFDSGGGAAERGHAPCSGYCSEVFYAKSARKMRGAGSGMRT